MAQSSKAKLKSVSPTRATAPVLQVRMRIRRGRDIALGPGKGDLLGAIEAAGSLLAAARSLGMSYMRAWSLVQEMHRCFREPLVVLERGGKNRGGARLTPEGRDVLELYLEMERQARGATDATWQRLQTRLRK